MFGAAMFGLGANVGQTAKQIEGEAAIDGSSPGALAVYYEHNGPGVTLETMCTCPQCKAVAEYSAAHNFNPEDYRNA